MKKMESRRDFVKKTSLGLGTCLMASVSPAIQAQGANEKINIGFIAVGGRNMHHVRGFMQMGKTNITAICDVDEERLNKAGEEIGESAKKYKDFRKLLEQKDVDAVIIAPPDHWHCTAAIYACQAGKDIYLEKPVGQNINEELQAIAAVRKYDRIAQIGLQQRSGPHFIEAAEIVRSGKLGKITSVHTFNQWGMYEMGHKGTGGIGTFPDSDVPAGVDYDMWLGPAPKRPFNKNRFHFSFYFNWDYAGGMVISWGVHLFDIVQWVMGTDVNRVSVSGGQYYYKHNVDTPDTAEAVFDCPGYTMTYSMRHANGFPLHDEMDHGIYFFGTDGTLFVNRNVYEFYTEKNRKKPELSGKVTGMDEQHKNKFLESIKSRKRTDSDIETGHLSGIPGHLTNIAYRVGRTVKWDNQKKTIIDDPEAVKLLSREPRDPWKIKI